jgi:hypothetical protein
MFKFIHVDIKNKKSLARKQCANWFFPKCLGAMFYRDINNNLRVVVDSKFASKECVADSKEGCSYFENVVLPGISK